MPREIKTTLALDGEQAFNRGLQSIDREMRVLNSQLGALSSAYDKNNLSVEQLTEQNKLMQDRAEASRNKVHALEQAVSESEEAYRKALAEVEKYTDEQLRSEAAGIAAAQALEKAEKSMDGYRIKLANAQKQLNQNEKALEENAASIKKMEKAADGSKIGKVFSNIAEKAGDIAKKLGTVISKIADAASKAAKISFKAAEKSAKAFADVTGAAMSASVKAVTAYMGAVTGASAALFKLSAGAALAADDINTLSAQTGLSTAEIQKMQYAADLIDVDLDTLTGSMAKLIKNMNTATSGTGDAAEAFSALGISITDSNGELRNNKEVFNEAIAALSKLENETQRDAYAMAIFGKSAQDLNPLILGGAEALEELGTNAENAGLILGEDALSKLNSFNDSLDILKANAAAGGRVIALEFSSEFQKFTDVIGAGIPELAASFAGLFDGTESGGKKFGNVLAKLSTSIGGLIVKAAPQFMNGINQLLLSIVSTVNVTLPRTISTLLPALLTGFFGLVDGLILQIPKLVPNIAEGAFVLFTGLITGLESSSALLVEQLPETIAGILAALEEQAPVFLEGASGLFGNLLTALSDTVAMIAPEIPTYIGMIAENIISNIPQLAATAMQIISAIGQAVISSLPLIISAAVQIVKTLANTLITPENIQLIISTAFEVLMAIVDAIIENLDEIIDVALQVILTLTDELLNPDNIQKLITAGFDILMAVIEAIIDNIDEILIAVETIVGTFYDTLLDTDNMATFVSMGFQVLLAVIKGLCQLAGKFIGFAGDFFDEISSAFSNIDWGEIGVAIVEGICTGLLGCEFMVDDYIANFGDYWVTGFKDILGINSPSRVMRDKIGKPTGQGVLVGFEESMKDAESLMQKAIPTDFAIAPTVDVEMQRYNHYLDRMDTAFSNGAQSYDNSRSIQITNYITIEEARLDSEQDIEQTAEELAAETNRILAGVGE